MVSSESSFLTSLFPFTALIVTHSFRSATQMPKLTNEEMSVLDVRWHQGLTAAFLRGAKAAVPDLLQPKGCLK